MLNFVEEFFQFKSSPEYLARVAEEDAIRAAVSARRAAVDALTTFPGNLAEFNLLAKYEHVILDTGRPDKEVTFRSTRSLRGDEADQQQLAWILIERGCIGFIYVRETERTEQYVTAGPRSAGGIVTRNYRVWRGVPIARKQ